MLHKQLPKINKTIGFSTRNAKAGEGAWVLTRSFVTSDSPDFYRYIEAICSTYIYPLGLNDSSITDFLVLHHADDSVDVYVNQVPTAIEFLSKRSVEKGEVITMNDIGDIRRLRFIDIEIKPSDNIVYCFKTGWRFGLFFDFTYSQFQKDYQVDLDVLQKDLGKYYRQLLFDYLYKLVENTTTFTEMKKDGWFPYVEIINNEYKTLVEIYTNKFAVEERMNDVMAKFDKKRIEKIMNRWWNKPLFKSKKALLEAGVNSFLQQNDAGYILCIKDLVTEIEGILGKLHLIDNKQYTHKTEKIVTHLKKTAINKTGDENSLLLPSDFADFIKEFLFSNFSVENNSVELSRHTSSHGIAEAEQYTKTKALQLILILDQIYFFLP